MTFMDEARADPGVEEFLVNRSISASESSIKTYTAHIGIVRRRSEKALLDLSLSEARRLAAALKKELKSAATLGITMGLFYRFHGMNEHAGAFKIRTPRPRLSPSEILTPEDVNALLQAADSLRDRALTALLWESGARIHEVMALDWEDLTEVGSPENGGQTFVKAWFKKAKIPGAERSCLLVEAAPHLLRWRDAYPMERGPGAPVFVSAEHSHFGDRLLYEGARFILKRLGRRAGLTKNTRPHIFRHSAITHLLRRGWTEAQVKKAAGLARDSRQLARYSHLVDEDVDRRRLQMHGLKLPEAPEETPLMPADEGDLPGLPAEGFHVRVSEREEAIVARLERLEKLLDERLEA